MNWAVWLSSAWRFGICLNCSPELSPGLQSFVALEQTQGGCLTGKLCVYTPVVSSFSASNLCRYIKSKIFLRTALWRIMREGASELFFQPVDLGAVADGKRFTVFLALCVESGALSFSFLPWQRGKMTRCCFAVGDAPPCRGLRARDLIFQGLVKSACDLQTGFQSHDGQIHSEHNLSCDSPSSRSPQSHLLHSQIKPDQAYLLAHGKMFLKEPFQGREVRRSSPRWLRCPLMNLDI